MEKSRKYAIGLLGFLGLALVTAFVIGMLGRSSVFAAPPSQTAPTAQSNGNNAEQRLLDSFMTNFTSRLGVDETRLNSAFTDAVNSTADQAVRDGTITQAQADEAKTTVQKGGFKGLIERGFSSSDTKAISNPGDEAANPKAALIATMNKIGVSADDMQRGFEAGKSPADLAREHNVDATTLKNMVLATFKSQLDTAVHDGKLTQAQADVEYQKFAQIVDSIINGTGGKTAVRVNNDGYNTTIDAPTEAAERAAWNAAPPILGMQAVDMKQAMGGTGKSLTDLAREHNVNPQTLHDAMLHAGKAELDKAIAAKTLTQAQADSDYRVTLTAWVDTLMNTGVK